ncbi:MAG: lipoprotein [Bacteroidales bacterium]|nr:lipoprotein [Bacteroidales bacterium]
MKKIILLIVATTLLTGCGKDMKTIELTDWQFQYNDQWLPATVPGCIHTDLMAQGIIPDPFYGTNEDSVQWVGDRMWKYRTIITRDMWEGYEHCELVLQGVTYCDVTLEGNVSGGHFQRHAIMCDNMFREYRVCLFDVLMEGNMLPDLDDSTLLEITFYPIEINNEDHFVSETECEEDGYPWPDMEYDLPDHRAMSRMAPYMLGWDWGPKLSTVGILGSVKLECYNGKREEEPIAKPKSWNVELRQEKDSIGQSFTFYKNGKPIFAKGANWIPCHSFPILTPAMKERYRYLLTSAKEANFNMLRVWGGGIYEPDYFYDLCDSLGIMVWQDFNFSCALYPSDSNFLNNVKIEAEQQVRRIAKHPCVVVWCGNNEVKNGWEDWGWQQQYNWTPEQIATLQHGIDTLFGTNGILAQAVKKYDPLHRAYITTSPLYGWGHPECVTHGDSHYWGVWWGEQPFEMYKEKTGRFMSEYGFQSYPDYSTVCRYCPEDQRCIDSPTMKNHQKHGRGLEIIDKAMMQYYGVSSKDLSLEDFCYVSQLLQAWGMGYGIYQHLTQQPLCMGTLYWQLDDCWPVASWSSIDYYGNWKALHYRARDLFDDNVDLKQFNNYYKNYPRRLHLAKASYGLNQDLDKRGRLSVTVEANNYLRDVMLQTEPHVDGHFDYNYFDLNKGATLTATFIPLHPDADLSQVKVTVKCLNDIYNR